MIEKIPHTIGNQIFPLNCGFTIGYGIGQKYRLIWVSVLVLDLNQNNGFGGTLVLRHQTCPDKNEVERIKLCVSIAVNNGQFKKELPYVMAK